MSKSQSNIMFKVFFLATICFTAIYLMKGVLQKTEESLEFGTDGDNPGFRIVGVSQQGVDKLFDTSGDPTEDEIVGAGDLFGPAGGSKDPGWYKFAVFIDLPNDLTNITLGRSVDIIPQEESVGVTFLESHISEVCGTNTHRRFKMVAQVRCDRTQDMHARIAMKIYYFDDLQGKAMLNFTGPFLAEQPVADERSENQKLYLLDEHVSITHGNLGLEIVLDKNETYHDEAIMAYDISGKRYFLGNTNAKWSGGPQVSNRLVNTILNFPPAALDCVTVGEEAKTLLFRNIQIKIPAEKVHFDTNANTKLPGMAKIFAVMYPAADGDNQTQMASEEECATFNKMSKHCDQFIAKAAIRCQLLHNLPEAIEEMLSYLEKFPGDFEFKEIASYKGVITEDQVSKIMTFACNGARVNEYGKVIHHKAPSFIKAFTIRLAAKSDPHLEQLKLLAKLPEPWIWWSAIDAIAKAGLSIDEFPAKKSLYHGKTITLDAVALLGDSLTVEFFRFERNRYFKFVEIGLAIKNNKGVLKSLENSLRAVNRPILHRELVAGIVTRLNRKHKKIFGLMGTSVADLKRRIPGNKWYEGVNLTKGQKDAIIWLNSTTAE